MSEWSLQNLNSLVAIYQKYDISQENLVFTSAELGGIQPWIDCSDQFIPACADGEYIYPEDLSDLWQAAADLAGVDDYASVYFEYLWIARKRGQAPLESWLRKETNDNFKLRALFDSVKGEK